jgi:hypothetical protein
MDKPSPGWLLSNVLLEMDEARNASPRVTQQPSEMVKARDMQLTQAIDRIACITPRARGSGF